jgi:hypothetical protein
MGHNDLPQHVRQRIERRWAARFARVDTTPAETTTLADNSPALSELPGGVSVMPPQEHRPTSGSP